MEAGEHDDSDRGDPRGYQAGRDQAERNQARRDDAKRDQAE